MPELWLTESSIACSFDRGQPKSWSKGGGLKKKKNIVATPRISHSGQGATQTSQINVVDVESGNTDSERTATHPLSYRRRSKLDHHILRPQADNQARTKSNRVSKSRPVATDGNRHWRFRKMTRCAHRSLREDFVQWKAHVDERSGMVRVFCAGRKKSHRGPMSVTSMCVERGLGAVIIDPRDHKPHATAEPPRP